jgi:hypothetical protein
LTGQGRLPLPTGLLKMHNPDQSPEVGHDFE